MHKIFLNLLHEMGPQGPTKRNAQLIRQNDFYFHINQTSVLFNQENT